MHSNVYVCIALVLHSAMDWDHLAKTSVPTRITTPFDHCLYQMTSLHFLFSAPEVIRPHHRLRP